MFRPRAFFLFAVFAVLVPRAAAADDESCRLIDVGAQYVANVNENTFHDYWHRGKGAEVYAAVPLTRSSVLAGVRYLHNEASSEEFPDFHSVFTWIGISIGVDVTQRGRVSLGSAVGATQWIFDDESITGLRYELEMGTEVFARARVIAGRGWSIATSFTHQVTYTHERIRLSYISVGLTRTFVTPGWLREMFE